MANITREPTTGSIAFTGVDAYFLNSGDNKLVFTGYAPAVNPGFVYPTTRALNLSGKIPSRPRLWLVGQPLTIGISEGTVPDTGSLSLTGYAPDLINTTPPAIRKLPPTVALNITGYESALDVLRAEPGVGSLALTGVAPNATLKLVTHPRYPFFGRLSLTGYPPTIDIANSGISIQNTSATTEVPVNYQIDDRTGFKVKIKQPLIEEYTGFMTRPDSLDKRSEQDFLRSKVENQRGAERPDDTGKERHIDTEYPDGVSTEDL